MRRYGRRLHRPRPPRRAIIRIESAGFMSGFDPIAIVGMGGVFPDAPDLDAFWRNVAAGHCSIKPVPAGRWAIDAGLAYRIAPDFDHVYSPSACFVDEFELDPRGMAIDPDVLRSLDPVHCITLEAGRQAIESLVAGAVDPSRTGVILAAIALPTDGASAVTGAVMDRVYERQLFDQTGDDGGLASLRYLLSPGRSRVTYYPASVLSRAFGLTGGAMTLDAACASSLYAIKIACDELQSGRLDAVLAGGVSRPDSLFTQMGFSQLRALSKSGRCRPFDAAADGLVVGEGAGIVVLKRLSDAVGDGDAIWGVIRGLGWSNDTAGSLLAADAEGQLRAMRAAYDVAGWRPEDVDLIECHGTGTPLGDVTELRGMRKLWADCAWRAGQCAIGSVKSNIGHLLTAANAAGLIKTLLAMRQERLPASLGFENAPAGVDLADSPFRVQSSAAEWARRDADTPRRAAVSGFGFGGINAHLLLEEHCDASIANHRAGGLPAAIGDKRIEARSSRVNEPVAIVGMSARFGGIESLRMFQEVALNSRWADGHRAPNRLRSYETVLADSGMDFAPIEGLLLDQVDVHAGSMHLPPNEIRDVLPQQLIALQSVRAAIDDAKWRFQNDAERTGVFVGIEFDWNTTNYHHRWKLVEKARDWARRIGWQPDGGEFEQWLAAMRDASSPPLTAARVQGALGNIVASRIAREFGFGGPSFAISADELSGLWALRVAINALNRGEIDVAIVAAADLPGDPRSLLARRTADQIDGGRTIAEGAAALILRRAEDVCDRVGSTYGLIRGVALAGPSPSTDRRGQIERTVGSACEQCDVLPETLTLIESGGGCAAGDTEEINALQSVFGGDGEVGCAISGIGSVIGQAGAAMGLAQLVAALICVHQRVLPACGDGERWARRIKRDTRLFAARQAQYWLTDASHGPRRAGVSVGASDGSCGFAIIEEAINAHTASESRLDAGPAIGEASVAVFGVAGDDVEALRAGLANLRQFADGAVGAIELIARRWHMAAGANHRRGALAIAIVARDLDEFARAIAGVLRHITDCADQPLDGRDGVYYSPTPLGAGGRVAFVFPGSGNHFTGMGLELGGHWPSVLRATERDARRLRSQMQPALFAPQRLDWSDGWRAEVRAKQTADPAGLIMAQVSCSVLSSDILRHLGVRCDAVIGYSLGETASLFASRAWCDRDEMLRRMEASNLFRSELAGCCDAARRFWRLNPDESVDWCVMTVGAAVDVVREIIEGDPFVFLLIVNTPDECVIGGRRRAVESCIRRLRCRAIEIVGAATVHCPIAGEVADAYRALHELETTSPDGVDVYSAANARVYDVTRPTAADSILRQALVGFDFSRVIEQAHADGIRVFVEAGPQASCTRMIGRILKGKPHVTASVLVEGAGEVETMIRTVGRLFAQRAVADLDGLYGDPNRLAAESMTTDASELKQVISVPTSMPPPVVSFPSDAIQPSQKRPEFVSSVGDNEWVTVDSSGAVESTVRETDIPLAADDCSLPVAMARAGRATADAHDAFLRFSRTAMGGLGTGLTLQSRLLEHATPAAQRPAIGSQATVAFDRDQCMEFAVGSLATVLGPTFADVDTYPVRVRLPDEPLMLVDRIVSVDGEMASLGSGRIVTEHDVLDGAWYLDGGRAPVCITVEAGQADLFLCSYLGIDLAVRGTRSYRLLDAKIVFHRDLPCCGEVIRYDIVIDRFVRQGETYMFFFRYQATIDGEPLLTMTDGCAGFFTEREIAESGGILERPVDAETVGAPWRPMLAMGRESYDEGQVDALRRGDLESCFGEAFGGIVVPPWQRIGDGRMRLVHRVASLDPDGGRFGRGMIRAEADIHPGDWFLTCHFVDDMVMPGTLMYECCAHALRIFAMRMGWVTDDPEARWAPVLEQPCQLRCRGPVTPRTRVAAYELHVKSVSLEPEPRIIADAHMYADDRKVVLVSDLSLRLVGANRDSIQRFWNARMAARRAATHSINVEPIGSGITPIGGGRIDVVAKAAVYDRGRILAFAEGKPSEAFGEPYRVFDSQRRLARLPRPPYAFLDRITEVQSEAWKTAPGGWIEGQYDVPPDAWYFAANRQRAMPFAVLLEIALQPCGWLAAYVGSALRSDVDLSFRNLDGSATMYEEITPDSGMLTTRVRLTHVSHAGGMIIEKFDMQIWRGERIVYDGDTAFGFFSAAALAQQIGVRDAADRVYVPNEAELDRSIAVQLPNASPRSPDDTAAEAHESLALPSEALLMLDAIDVFVPDGGPNGLGFIRASKTVDPGEWFFDAHFYQDPVCPGSLGLESFIQLLKVAAIHRWGDELGRTHRFESMAIGSRHRWTYRGQVIPSNRRVEVEAVVSRIEDGDTPLIEADGLLKVDGVIIYEMNDFALRLVRRNS